MKTVMKVLHSFVYQRENVCPQVFVDWKGKCEETDRIKKKDVYFHQADILLARNRIRARAVWDELALGLIVIALAPLGQLQSALGPINPKLPSPLCDY